MSSEKVEYAGTPLTVAQPSGSPRAGVIVIQEAWGVTEHLVSVAESLAGEGYLAAVPHLYHRVGDPVVDPIDGGDFSQVRSLLTGLTGETIGADVRAAAEYLREAGCGSVGIIGFCMGGTVAFWAAAEGPVDAAATFYGGGVAQSRWRDIPSALELAPQVRVPWLGVYGDEDKSIPVDDVERLRAELEQVNVPAQIVRYADAGHAFATDERSEKYVSDAAEDAWIRTREFFAAHLG